MYKKSRICGIFYFVSGTAGVSTASPVAPGIADCDAASPWIINSLRKSLCWDAISDFADTNANNAHNTKNIVANHAVARVRKLPAAAPVNAPPNIDAADEPDIPLPSDFCNKMMPVIKIATIINKTNKIVNIYVYPLLCANSIYQNLKLQGFSTTLQRRRCWRPFWMPHCPWRYAPLQIRER